MKTNINAKYKIQKNNTIQTNNRKQKRMSTKTIQKIQTKTIENITNNK